MSGQDGRCVTWVAVAAILVLTATGLGIMGWIVFWVARNAGLATPS